MTDTNGPVLLAYDGSESSATAIAVAGRLLRGRQAVVCHAWVGLSTAIFDAAPGELPGALREAALELDQAYLKAAEGVAAEGAQLARQAGFEARPLAVREERKTWRTLLAAADEAEASAIVVGAHRLSGIGRALLGSVSTAVLHHARRPVLIVPAVTVEVACDGPLLLCYDGSDPASLAIEAAGELLASRSALLLQSWESWVAEAPALAGLSGGVSGMAVKLDEIAEEQSKDLTSKGVEVAKASGFDTAGVPERATGPLWRAVLDTADQHDCAAIVVGSRGLTGLSAALGSVSDGVVHHSRRPVLVVRPEEER